MTLPNITGEFRVVGDPTLKYVGQENKAVVKLRVVASRSTKNQSGEWEKKGEIWANATAWDAHAESVAATVKDKDLVLITGQIETQEYERKDGGKGSSNEILYAKIAVVPPRQQSPAQSTPPASNAWGQQSPADPWSTGPAQGASTQALPPF